jgi:hypothetical protein
VLKNLLEYVETSYVHTFEDGMQYCQIITVNVTAASGVGQSIPTSVSTGFPIGNGHSQIVYNIMSCIVIFMAYYY